MYVAAHDATRGPCRSSSPPLDSRLSQLTPSQTPHKEKKRGPCISKQFPATKPARENSIGIGTKPKSGFQQRHNWVKGKYEPGDTELQVTDPQSGRTTGGNVVVTNKPLVYLSKNRTAEWPYKKITSINQQDNNPDPYDALKEQIIQTKGLRGAAHYAPWRVVASVEDR